MDSHSHQSSTFPTDPEKLESDSVSSTKVPEASSLQATQQTEDAEIIRLSEDSSNALVVPLSNQQSRSFTHADILLHALLEERCLNEARSIYGIGPSHHNGHDRAAHVQVEGQARYQHLTTQLASLGILSSAVSGESHATARQRYREGLDVLSRPRVNTFDAGTSRRALTGRETGSAASESVELSHSEPSLVAPDEFAHLRTSDILLQTYRPALPPHMQKLLLGARGGTPNALSLPSTADRRLSRYELEFEEMNRLGSGGFGTVYQARNRFDNQHYAIKKIPLSTKRLARVQQRGSVEIEELLKEVRVLATLDHPNIVRYFGGWIEWSDRSSKKAGGDGSTVGVSSSDALISSAVTETPSLRTARTDDDPVASSIIFEDDSAPLSNGDALAGASNTNAGILNSGSTESLTENHFATTVTRSEALHQSLQTPYTPSLALHIQMSIHPMTLAEYLSTPPCSPAHAATPPVVRTETDIFRPSHCYHLHPSLRLLHCLLDGLEYLHEQGIVHRDIKPSNIFLGWKKRSSPRGGHGGSYFTRTKEVSKGSASCEDCALSASGTLAFTSSFETKVDAAMEMEMEVRIGDFGLAGFERAESGFLRSSEEDNLQQEQQSEEVGTALYRPVSPIPRGAFAALAAACSDTNNKGTNPMIHPESYRTPSSFLHGRDRAADNLIPNPTRLPSLSPSPIPKPNKDIYALALIMLELLTPFSTRAERIHVLQDLKCQAQFPLDFGCGIRDPEVRRKLKGLVGAMLWVGLDVGGVRRRVREVGEIIKAPASTSGSVELGPFV